MSAVVHASRRTGPAFTVCWACAILLAVSPAVRAAADDPNATFDQVFGEDARRVAASREKTDDVDFATKLFGYARSADDAAFKALLLNKVFDFASKDPAGYATAAEAIELLPEADPKQAEVAAGKLLSLRRLQYQKAPAGKAKGDAGAALLDILLDAADRQMAAKQFREASGSYRDAVRLATEINSPLKGEAASMSEHAQKIGLRVVQLTDQFRKQPAEPAGRELTLLWLADLNDPKEAAEFALKSGDPYLQKITEWLNADPATIDEAKSLELAEWYAKMARAKDLNAVSKQHRLSRAAQFYGSYLTLHAAKDPAGLKARVALDRTNEELKQLGASASTGPAATRDAKIVLFDGKDLSAWQALNGGPPSWEAAADGTLQVKGSGDGDIVTKQKWSDFKLHVEFMVPAGQKEPNSGVFLQNCYEIQIADFTTPPLMGTGSFFRKVAPTSAPTKKVGQWQTFDVDFKAARYDGNGKKTKNARATVVWNGVTVHDNVELEGATAKDETEVPAPAPLRLQSYKGTIVKFRNLTITPGTAAAGE